MSMAKILAAPRCLRQLNRRNSETADAEDRDAFTGSQARFLQGVQ